MSPIEVDLTNTHIALLGLVQYDHQNHEGRQQDDEQHLPIIIEVIPVTGYLEVVHEAIGIQLD